MRRSIIFVLLALLLALAGPFLARAQDEEVADSAADAELFDEPPPAAKEPTAQLIINKVGNTYSPVLLLYLGTDLRPDYMRSPLRRSFWLRGQTSRCKS